MREIPFQSGSGGRCPVSLANLPQALHSRIGSKLGLEACQRIKGLAKFTRAVLVPGRFIAPGRSQLHGRDFPGLTQQFKDVGSLGLADDDDPVQVAHGVAVPAGLLGADIH